MITCEEEVAVEVAVQKWNPFPRCVGKIPPPTTKIFALAVRVMAP